MKDTEKTVKRLLDTPMTEWEAECDRLSTGQKAELVHVLDGLAVRTARLSAYVGMRYGSGCGDQGHKDAVKEQNKVAAKVRRALGYSIPNATPINF